MSSRYNAAAAAVFSGQFDDGLVIVYEVLPDVTPTHIQHDGIERTAVRFDAGASGLGAPVKSVRLRFRKYGSPIGPITVNIRNGSDDTIAATIGTFDIQHILEEGKEMEVSLRSGYNTYDMVATDLVSVEFPSSATDGFEITANSGASNPANYTSRSYDGAVWSSTADPLAIIIEG